MAFEGCHKDTKAEGKSDQKAVAVGRVESLKVEVRKLKSG
jgi:hypothetical protein